MNKAFRDKIGVCMVLGAYYPEVSGGAVQCFNLVEKLKDKFDFHIIATHKISSSQSRTRRLFSQESIFGTTVFRINLFPGDFFSETAALLAVIIIFFRIKNKIDIFHLHGYTRKSCLITALAKLFRKKTVLKTTSFGVDDPLSLKNKGVLIRWLYPLIDIYILTSPAQKQNANQAKIPEEKVFMIPNGVNLNKFYIPDAVRKINLRKELNIPQEAQVIISVGFFSQDKGIDLFAESLLVLPADKLTNIFLIFVGSRDTRALEVDKAVVKKVDEVIDHLVLRKRSIFIEATHDIDKYYQAADIFILATKREGLPNALLEAMASGLSCIVNRLSGITDYVINSQNSGYLLDSLRPSSIAEALKKVIGNRELQKDLGLNAYLRIEEEFNLDKIKDSYEKLYLKLVGEIT